MVVHIPVTELCDGDSHRPDTVDFPSTAIFLEDSSLSSSRASVATRTAAGSPVTSMLVTEIG